MNNLNATLKKLRTALIGAYAAALVISLSAFFVLNYFHQKSLAESFALSARTSIMINDLRQAMLTLNPALKSNFDSVRFETSEGHPVFSLPSDVSETGARGLFQLRIPVQVLNDPVTPSAGNVGTLSFYYDGWTSTRVAFFVWLVLLSFALPFSRWARALIVARHEESLAFERANAKAAMARQVAHDIRSPLSALMIVEKSLKNIPDDHRKLLAGAAGRINEIAQDLLDGSRPVEVAQSPDELLRQVIAEKSFSLGPRSEIKIIIQSLPTAPLAVSPAGLTRVFSNILNNAVEVLGTKGEIIVSGTTAASFSEYTVTDNGKGMTDELLSRVGHAGVTEGKVGGSGLGLSHAINTLRACGGDVVIRSELGKGTSVTLRCPQLP